MRDPWAEKHFTDPRHHNPDSFRYLVQANGNGGYFSRYLEQVNFSDQPSLSLSLISENQVETWKEGSGFIIQAPPSTIFAAHHTDMLTANSFHSTTQEFMTKLENDFSRFGLPTPDDILKRAVQKERTWMNYTEVVGVGTSANGEKMKISGIFLRADSLGTPLLSKQEVNNIKRLAEKHHLPVLILRPSKNTFALKITVEEEPFFWDHKNRKFKIRIHSNPAEFRKLLVQAKEKNRPLLGWEMTGKATIPTPALFERNLSLHPQRTFSESLESKDSNHSDWSIYPVEWVFQED